MLGVIGYYQKFILAFTDLVQLFMQLTCKTIPLYG